MIPDIALLSEENRRMNDVHTPVFFRLSDTTQKKNFLALIESSKVWLSDEISDQLKELIKSRNPSAGYTAKDFPGLIEQHLNGCPPEEYGVWVYYPWSGRLVHLLDEDEFVELRTSANRNKITMAERNVLAAKKVGVIGLSVGQSVSVTLALERGCGELRLADFDTLELNNLNRIRTGVHNLGLLKAYSVAREIAEIDPFFKVVCYTEGINENNISHFLDHGGRLDMVIDECDSVDIKILCRIKARELHIPVLMEASDRGTFDVERFDLHPDRPIMHGWLEHLQLDFEVLKNLKTNEEKVPYMLPISGLETLSTRMRASMVELRSTITTWPQLATAVTLGGALAADTCRRIFLDQFTGSGRYFIDLETLIPDTRPRESYVPVGPRPRLNLAEIDAVSAKAAAILSSAVPISTQLVETLVAAAIKAPSAGNAQPWKWHYSHGYLFLFHEDTGIISFGDPGGCASQLALGAALENLELTAGQNGFNTHTQFFPLAGHDQLVAAVSFTPAAGDHMPANYADLADFIDARVTNRNPGTREPILPEMVASLSDAVSSVAGAGLILKTSPDDIHQFAGIFGQSERLKLLNPASHYEFFEKELRWTDQEAGQANDGISIRSLAISGQEEILLKMVRNPEAAKLLAEWKAGRALEFTARKYIATSSAIALITMPGYTALDFLNGGKAAQRMWLTAAKNKIGLQPVMSPLLYWRRHHTSAVLDLPDFVLQELKELDARFAQLFPAVGGQGFVFLCRLTTGPKPAAGSLRRPLQDVLSFA